MKINTLLLLLILSLILDFTTCDTTEPPPNGDKPVLTLKLEDASCTEAWITLITTNLSLPTAITLKQNDQVIRTINLDEADTLLYIDSLLPNQIYIFQSLNHPINQSEIKSNKLQVTTMDTTSPAFTWQKFTFGQHSSSILSDIAIINENNIWAVGEIYMLDSLGNPDPHAYNAIHWNGSTWELKKIYFPTVCGSTSLTSYPAKAIFVFDDGQIWISSSGDKIAILNNSNQINQFCLPANISMPINKIWGNSSNDLYVVGNAGNIAHYQNGVWNKIESGTDLPINDIYGGINPLDGKTEIICVASDAFINSGVRVISINENNTSELLNATGLNWSIGSVCFSAGFKYYIVGNGLFVNLFLNNSPWSDLNHNRSITQYYMDYIRGTGYNDIIVVGAYGEVIHFNGVRWESLKNGETTLTSGSYFKAAIKGQVVVTVGYDGSQGVILMGSR